MKKKLFRLLPSFLQTEMIRRSLDVSKSIDARIQFKVAETDSEFEQAFRLVHDAYVREGFIAKQPSGLRVIPQQQLPSTHVLIAKKGQVVIGTLTLVRNSKTKLPLERVFNLNSLQHSGTRIAEVTCLSVKSEYRRAEGGTVFASLMKFMYEFSAGYAGIDELVVAVFPKDALFYESLLCFNALERKPVDYLGAPAIALHLNLKQAPMLYHQAYNHRCEANNLYRFFVDVRLPNFNFPERLFCEINYPTLTAELAQKFFAENQNSNVIQLRSISNQVRNPRAEVSCTGHLKLKPFEKDKTLKVMDVSAGGLKIITSEELTVGIQYKAELIIANEKSCQVSAVVVWKDGLGSYGLSLAVAEPIWFDFVSAVTKESGMHKNNLKLVG